MLIDNQLYRHIPSYHSDEDVRPWKLCVGPEQKTRVLQEVHSTPAAEHLGVRKTKQRLANQYYWPGMFRDRARFLRSCDLCQRFKVSQQVAAGHMLTQVADEPWSVVCADFVGPLP